MGSTPRPVPWLTHDGFEMIHQVNFLAHTLLTLRLLPSLARSPAPRIICTTSCFHYLGAWDMNNWNGQPGDDYKDANVAYYQHNKLLFQTWLTELQARMGRDARYKHVTVNGVHPGYVNSGIWKIVNPEEGWVPWVVDKLLAYMANWIAITPQQGYVLCSRVALLTPLLIRQIMSLLNAHH